MMLFLEPLSAVFKQEAEHPHQSELPELTVAFDICLKYYKREREGKKKMKLNGAASSQLFPSWHPPASQPTNPESEAAP